MESLRQIIGAGNLRRGFLSIVVATLLAGILAMHSPSVPSAPIGADAVHSLSAVHVPASEVEAPQPGCEGDGCDSDPGMILMACILAVVVLLAASGALRPARSRLLRAGELAPRPLRDAPRAAVRHTAAPSLELLSICRT